MDERLTQRGRDHVLLTLGHVGLRVAHPMNATPLPRRAHDPPDRRLEPLMSIRNDQLGAAQTSANQALEERRPEYLRLRWPDVQADDLALAFGVHRHGDYRGDTGDASSLALLEVGRIEPEIRPVADERTIKEGVHPVVDVLAQLGHRALADPRQPIACTRSSTRRVETPPIQASWMTATRAFSEVRRGSRNGGK